MIVQELLKQPRRYGALLDRLPGISTSVLADRLRRLERAGVVAREPGAVGAGVVHALTPRGQELEEALRALRRWGAGFLADPTADGSAKQGFDVTYVAGIEAIADGQFQLVVDDRPATLHFAAGRLRQESGAAPGAGLVVRTSSAFLDRWAAGEAGWDDGRARGSRLRGRQAMTFPRRRLVPLTQRVRGRIGKASSSIPPTPSCVELDGRRHDRAVRTWDIPPADCPALIIETGVPPRWYIPPGDIRWDRLTPRPHHTSRYTPDVPLADL